MSLRLRRQVLRLLVQYGAPHDFVHGLSHDHALAGGERDERVRSGFDIANQLGIEHERLAAESGQFDNDKDTLSVSIR